MNLVTDINIKNKTVLLRLDLNVPIKDGVITDNTRIQKSLKTINFLLYNNAKIIIVAHLGRVKSNEDKEKNTLYPVLKELEKLTNKEITFIKDIYDNNTLNTINSKSNKEIILLENIRNYDYPNKLEKTCSEELSKKLSTLAEVYVFDAFGTSHRKHASTYGVSKYMESYYGFLVSEEINILEDVINVEKRPFTVFMGGAKVDDKLPIIKSMLKKCDYLLLGGGVLNSFLKVQGFDILDSLATNDDAILQELKELLTTYKDKIITTNEVLFDDNKIVDINITKYIEYIDKSSLIFVNGTPGIFENPKYQTGTNHLLNILKESSSKVIIGGGDTASACKLLNIDFDNTSSGGGATLDYIGTNKIKVLEKSND